MNEFSTEREIREAYLGLDSEAEFEPAIQEALILQRDQEPNPGTVQLVDTLLQEQAVDIDPRTAPSPLSLQNLAEQDWADVRESDDSFMALWSRTNRRSLENYYAAYMGDRNAPATKTQAQEQAALVRSLPLLHSTSFDALMASTEEGAFHSNRQLHSNGIDVSEKVGHTTSQDRALGLDQYIFADYARPSTIRAPGEVVVVLEPESLQQPGSFLTEQDVADCTGPDGIDYQKYMEQVVVWNDLDEVVPDRVLSRRSFQTYGFGNNYPMSMREFAAGSDAEPDMAGAPQFSTWEAKIADNGEGLSTDYVRKIIFTDPAQREAFTAQFGDTYVTELALSDDLKVNAHPEDAQDTSLAYARNVRLFSIDERYAQEIHDIRAEDYAERQRLVSQDANAKSGYMLLQHPSPESDDAVLYDPSDFIRSAKLYSSAQEAEDAARRDYDPRGFYASQVEDGAREKVTDDNGTVRYVRLKPREVDVTEPYITVAQIAVGNDAAIIKDATRVQLAET